MERIQTPIPDFPTPQPQADPYYNLSNREIALQSAIDNAKQEGYQIGYNRAMQEVQHHMAAVKYNFQLKVKFGIIAFVFVALCLTVTTGGLVFYIVYNLPQG